MDTSVSLLDRLAAAPTDADWRRLFDLYAPLLKSWAARAGVSDADADDLVQEVMLAVTRGLIRNDVDSLRWPRNPLLREGIPCVACRSSATCR